MVKVIPLSVCSVFFKYQAVLLYSLEPQVVSGHTSGIKKALWSSDDQQILSADDKTVR